MSGPTALQIAKALAAEPDSWPRGVPNANDSIEAFIYMLQLCSDGSEKATENVKVFAEAGGIRAVVSVLEETARDTGRRARHIDPKKPEMSEAVQTLLLLADLQTMGVTLLSNFAATATAGESKTLEELKLSKAVGMVVHSLQLYPDNAEHGAACLAALMQLLPVDLEGALKVSAPVAIVSAMKHESATAWQLYLGARALKHMANDSAATLAVLRDAGALEALLVACRAPPGAPDCGAAWGVTDVAAKTQVNARGTIALLTGFDGFKSGARTASALDVNLFLLQDPVVLAPSAEAPALDGCIGVVVGAGAQGIGADAASGCYKVRIEYPEAKRGETVERPPEGLRLVAP